MKTAPKALIITGVVAAVLVVGVLVLRPLAAKRDVVSYITRPVGYADITATVSETGTVNPVNTVSVGTEVSGTIKTLGADFNSHVRKDQVLATLDPTDYQAAVDSSTANLHLAEANLNSAQVNVGKMKALFDLADLTLKRDTPLLAQGLINQNQVDTDTTSRTAAYQDYLASQAAVQVGDAQVAVAKGQLAQAQYNLSKTVIRSPMDGMVMARNVSIGQTVAASLQTPTLFSLATNLTDMQVDTSVDEADAGSVRQGAAARFTVTAFPNQTFTGTVTQVRVNPTVVQNVVTYDAVVAVHDSSGRLFPGMTAQVTIDVGAVAHVPAVPIAGVLYRPLSAPAGGGGGFGGFGGGGAGQFQSNGAAPGAQAVAGAPGSQVTVWVLQDGRPVPRRVIIGLSDSTSVQIASGPLAPGDPVIVAQRRGGSRAGATGASTTAANPAGTGNAAAGPAPTGAGPAMTPVGGGTPATNGAAGGAKPVAPGSRAAASTSAYGANEGIGASATGAAGTHPGRKRPAAGSLQGGGAPGATATDPAPAASAPSQGQAP